MNKERHLTTRERVTRGVAGSTLAALTALGLAGCASAEAPKPVVTVEAVIDAPTDNETEQPYDDPVAAYVENEVGTTESLREVFRIPATLNDQELADKTAELMEEFMNLGASEGLNDLIRSEIKRQQEIDPSIPNGTIIAGVTEEVENYVRQITSGPFVETPSPSLTSTIDDLRRGRMAVVGGYQRTSSGAPEDVEPLRATYIARDDAMEVSYMDEVQPNQRGLRYTMDNIMKLNNSEAGGWLRESSVEVNVRYFEEDGTLKIDALSMKSVPYTAG